MISLRDLEAEFKAKMHKALNFDGVDDYVRIPPSDTLDFTSELCAIVWMYGREGGRNQMLLHQQAWGSNKRGWFLQWDDGYSRTCFQLTRPETAWKSCIPRPSLNEWHMLSYNWRKPKLEMIVDGKVVDTFTWNYDLASAKDLPLIIGVEGRATNYFNGLIREVRIYNCALSRSEIKYIYYNPFDPLDLDHLVLWLAPASIDVANGKWWDLSKYKNHGTIYGATEVNLVEPEVFVL